jgi:hypothetical protein
MTLFTILTHLLTFYIKGANDYTFKFAESLEQSFISWVEKSIKLNDFYTF